MKHSIINDSAKWLSASARRGHSPPSTRRSRLQSELVHDDPDFDGLLRIVADKRKLAVGLVEKDYWVTHTLWALHRSGLELWFKGGTSLSKAFGARAGTFGLGNEGLGNPLEP
jgi:hypothetical protein